MGAAASFTSDDAADLCIVRALSGSETRVPANEEGDTLAHLCASNGRADHLKAVITRFGASVSDQANTYGATPALEACIRFRDNDFSVLSVLVAHGANLSRANKEGLTPSTTRGTPTPAAPDTRQPRPTPPSSPVDRPFSDPPPSSQCTSLANTEAYPCASGSTLRFVSAKVWTRQSHPSRTCAAPTGTGIRRSVTRSTS